VRILILTQYYPPEVGAAQTRLAAFARELGRAGHSVQVVTAHPNYPSGRLQARDAFRLSRRSVIDGIDVHRLWLYPATGTGLRRLASYLSFAATGLIGGLRAKRPDVVFTESPPLFLGVAGWAVARRFGAHFVLNVSDLWPDSVRDLGLMQRGPWLDVAERLERWLYRHADGVTAVTDGMRERLIDFKGVPAGRVMFLPNGAEIDRTPPLRSPASTSRRPRILYLGTLGHAHGLDVVLDAAAIARELDFMLVGDGSEKARLEREAKRRKLVNVHFEPPVPQDQVAARYADAAVGLSTLRPSELMEGVRPAKVIAMMACARPVLFSGSGEGAALVRAADAGIVTPPGDATALVTAAREILSDPARAEEMGSNGRRYIAEHLAWPKLVRDWLDQLEAIRKQGGGA
jgi:colanic acid biosynthesis glycosyl transferase WcaI